MFIHKTNFLMQALYPNFIWRLPTAKKEIFLTFDDGPIQEVTEFVLEELEKYQAKATFFCIGGNIEKYPNIFQKVVNQQHTIGNHTFNHLKGWDTEDKIYIDNFKKCEEIIEDRFSMFDVRNSEFEHQTSNIEHRKFRPPFGRIKRSQAKEILKSHEIVMWDVLTGDYDQSLSKERVLSKALQHTEQGSIVLFHDSIKASKNMMYALPRVLEHFSERGFIFKAI
jgi:peptidoglycan/xylan/chitin deacetylase (PgdA/CDA1 family)